MMKRINSRSLPNFSKDSAGIFLLDGREIKVAISRFQDMTTEGGRFHQFYTYHIGGKRRWSQKKPKYG